MSEKIREFLYHGTAFEIARIDVSKGRGHKDFDICK